MKLRTFAVMTALLIALVPRPAQAQGDFIKSKLKDLIERSGVYASVSSRSSIDNDVRMGTTIGLGYGIAGRQRSGVKYPFSFSGYGADLETTDGLEFGRIRARQIMSGIGYSWVHGKMVYGAQLGLGFSFNSVTLEPGVASAFSVQEPVSVDVDNSFVVRPQVKAEYFLTRKFTLRTQLSYTYTDPDVVIQTATQSFTREWRPHHVQLSFAVGFFPLRK